MLSRIVTRRRIRRFHRYLSIVVGLQLLLWSASGAFFAWSNIHKVRGEHLMAEPPALSLAIAEIISPGELELPPAIRDDVKQVILHPRIGTWAYEVSTSRDESLMFDATTGERLAPISKSQATDVAIADFKGTAQAEQVEYYEQVDSDSEYRGRDLPAYRVHLDDPADTKIWVSALRGTVVTRRNNRWRWFDWFWMLHTMDFQTRDNFNTWWLKAASLLGVTTAVSGFVLWGSTTTLFRRKKVSGNDKL